MFDKFNAALLAYTWAMLARLGLDSLVEQKAYELQPSADTRAQLGFRTVIAAIAVVIAGMAAVVVVDSFNTSIGTPSSTALSEGQQSILTGFGDFASLIGPLLIVAIAAVIIFQIRRVQ